MSQIDRAWDFLELDPRQMKTDLNEEGDLNPEGSELVDILVREVIQNSSDAGRQGSSKPVHVTFRIGSVSDDDQQFYASLLTSLRPHLALCDLSPPLFSDPHNTSAYLAIEDFNTTGITGDFHDRDNTRFEGFFYSHGVSGKGAEDQGSRGLGKLIMSMSSAFRTKLVLSHPVEQDLPWVMGMAALYSRRDSHGRIFAPHAHWGIRLGEKRVEPVKDGAFIDDFRRVFGLARTPGEHGTSVVVPFPRDGVDEQGLIRAVLLNHYFQILRGVVTVKVNDVEINRDTFADLATTYAADGISERRLAFLYEIISRIDECQKPDIIAELQESVTEASLDKGRTDKALEILEKGNLLHVRVPFSIRSKQSSEAHTTYVDCFYMPPEDGEGRWALYSRGGLVISDEARRFRGNAIAALVPANGAGEAGALLRDAENAAHTRWSERERVNRRWDKGFWTMQRMRGALDKVWQVIHAEKDREYPDLLAGVLSIPDDGKKKGGKKKKRRQPPPPPPPPTPRPPLYSIVRSGTGFKVKPGRGAADPSNTYPQTILVSVGYDTIRGNPIDKWKESDFVFGEGNLTVSFKDCTGTAEKNRVTVELDSENFEVVVSGFDTNRDVKIDARRLVT